MTLLRSARVLFIAWVILVAMDSSAASGQATGTVTAFAHVAVIPMDRERVLDDSTVLVVDGRIRELGPAAAVAIPKHATVIDGRGKYLMPGLADMHAHTWEEEDFPLLLANGVTTPLLRPERWPAALSRDRRGNAS
jgi:adenine deaminase